MGVGSRLAGLGVYQRLSNEAFDITIVDVSAVLHSIWSHYHTDQDLAAAYVRAVNTIGNGVTLHVFDAVSTSNDPRRPPKKKRADNALVRTIGLQRIVREIILVCRPHDFVYDSSDEADAVIATIICRSTDKRMLVVTSDGDIAFDVAIGSSAPLNTSSDWRPIQKVKVARLWRRWKCDSSMVRVTTLGAMWERLGIKSSMTVDEIMAIWKPLMNDYRPEDLGAALLYLRQRTAVVKWTEVTIGTHITTQARDIAAILSFTPKAYHKQDVGGAIKSTKMPHAQPEPSARSRTFAFPVLGLARDQITLLSKYASEITSAISDSLVILWRVAIKGKWCGGNGVAMMTTNVQCGVVYSENRTNHIWRRTATTVVDDR